MEGSEIILLSEIGF